MSHLPDSETVEIDPSALRGSVRVSRERTPLLRGQVSESADDSRIEIPLPLTEIEAREAMRVLHVDDEPDIGDLTATFLQRVDDNIDVISESNVVQALDRLREEQVDCIVSDYHMPNTDGLEFLEIVREQYPDLPFILFTGKGSEEIASEAIKAGVTDYMQKGGGADTYEMLANRVQNAVEQYRTQQQFWNALSWYQRLVEQEIAGVFILQNHEFVYVNQKFAETFGYAQRDLIGEGPLFVVADEDHDTVMEHLIDREERDADTFQYEFRGEATDGATFDVEVHGGAIDYNGEPAWIGVINHDAA
ncbi:response regulator [Halobacteriales archaeon Cl-PHB]